MFTVIFFSIQLSAKQDINITPYATSTSFHGLSNLSKSFLPNSPETDPPPTFRNFLPWHERPAMPTYRGTLGLGVKMW